MRRDMSQVDTSMDTSRWAWPSWLKAAAHTQFWRSVLQANWWSYCPLQISVTAGLRSHTPHAYSAPGFSCHRGLLQPVSDTSQPAPGHLSWWSGPSRLAKGLSITAQEGSHWGICLELEQKVVKLFRHGDEELQLGHRQWVLTCFFDCGIWGCLLGLLGCCTERRNILLDVGPHLLSPLCHNNILYPSVRTKFQGEHCGPCEFNKVFAPHWCVVKQLLQWSHEPARLIHALLKTTMDDMKPTATDIQKLRKFFWVAFFWQICVKFPINIWSIHRHLK